MRRRAATSPGRPISAPHSLSLPCPAVLSDPVAVLQFIAESNETAEMAYLELRTFTDEDAVRLNGRRNLYSGPGQEVLERAVADDFRPNFEGVRLQVLGPTPLHELDFGDPASKDVEQLRSDEAVERGYVTKASPAIEVASTYSLPFLLFRRGRLIGPSVGLTRALEEIIPRLRPGSLVLDPFAGTGVTAAIAHDRGSDITVVSSDSITHRAPWQRDAFEMVPNVSPDLLVLDPLYEDLPIYITRILPRIHPRTALVVAGDSVDLGWIEMSRVLIRRQGYRVKEFETHSILGQHLLWAERDLAHDSARATRRPRATSS